jgi:hypothetical protein
VALALRQKGIARFICGVTSPVELQTIVLAAERAELVGERISFTPPSALDARLLNPARWGELD